MNRRTATAVIFGFLLSLGACGDVDGPRDVDEGAEASAASDKVEIQQLFARYNSAMEGRRYQEVCSLHTRGFNDELVAQVRDVLGDRPVRCERALRLVAGSPASELTLKAIVVSGATASGRVEPSPSRWRFARVGSVWKVAYAN